MKEKRRFDEGFDNILIYDYDQAYQDGNRISGELLPTAGNRPVVSLNGEWHFCPDVFNSMVRSRWFEETRVNRDGLPLPYDFDFEKWDTVSVPGVWNNQKAEYALYEGPGIYFTIFDYERKPKKRVFLRMEAANYETRIWLNSVYLGRHLGGFTPFAAEITEYLKSQGNRLMILADNTRKGEQVPSVHYDWFNYGGIHRGVELIETPDICIRSVFLQLSPDKEQTLEYRLYLSVNSGEMIEKEAEIVIKELGQGWKVRCEKGENGEWKAAGCLDIDESCLKMWSPEQPFLYHVTVSCGNDVFRDTVGFRRITSQNRQIFLNGKQIFLRGMCVHEESAIHLRSMTEDEMEETLKAAKELGCNFLRLTHYPHNERMAKLADRMGIMLWEEIPVYWALEFENPKTMADAKGQLCELILRDWNRASVIIWSVGNENPDTDARYHFMKTLVDTARELDQSRLIGAACLIDVETHRIKDRLLSCLDVAGINEYYGWYLKDYGELRDILDHYDGEKPIIVTETGAEAALGIRGSATQVYTEECQAAIYEKQFEILFSYPFIRGITPWILYDYASMRRANVLQKGYNLKGLIGSDHRSRKLAWNVVKRAYERKEREENG